MVLPFSEYVVFVLVSRTYFMFSLYSSFMKVKLKVI